MKSVDIEYVVSRAWASLALPSSTSGEDLRENNEKS